MKFNLNLKKLPIWMVIKDIQNYIDWIKTIKREKSKPKSMWNKFKMNHNYFYTIYFPLVLPKEDQTLPDDIKKLRVLEMLIPVHRYLDDDLNFGELIVPEFNQFYDEENKPTNAYGIVYRFAFNKLSIRWVISRLLIIGALIFLLIKYPIPHLISEIVEFWKYLMV